MKYFKLTLTLAFTIISIIAVHAQPPFQTMTNRWKTSEKINFQGNTLKSGSISSDDWSAQWQLKLITGTEYARIENRHQPGNVLHCENGRLECGQMKMGAYSAQWIFKKIPNSGGYFEIFNRWKPNQKLHVENGRLELGKIHAGAYSAQWLFETVGHGKAQANSSSAYGSTTNNKPAQNANPYGQSATKNSNPYLNSANNSSNKSSNPYASNNTSGGAPAQDFYVPKGPVGKMYFRYTDQVQGGGGLELRVGSKIKVLPNQKLTSASTDMRGISFDPNNPKICGKVFTVQSMSPITFVEEFPEMMRNTNNGSFGFKVEVIQY